MFQLSTKPQSVGKILDESIRLFFASFKDVFIFSLVGSVAVMSPHFLMSEALTAAEAGDPAQIQGMFSQFLWLFAIGMLVFTVFYAAIFHQMDKISRGQESGFGESLVIGVKKLIPIVVAIILYSIAVVVGTLLLIVPGVILMLSLFFYMALIVCDNQGPVRALRTSHNLVWGNWWRTMAVFLVPTIVLTILVIVLMMILGVVAGVSQGDEAGGAAGVNQAFNIGITLFYAVLYPFMTAVLLVQLNDLKLRKQGSDLEARVAAAA